MFRWRYLLLLGLILVLVFVPGHGVTIQAQDPTPTPTIEETLQRIMALMERFMERLDALERRMDALEQAQEAYTPTPSEEATVVAEETPTKPTPSPTPRPLLVSLPFEDDFDMGPRAEWEPTQGTWRMVDSKYTADPGDTWSLTFVGDVGWTDYAVDVDVFYYGEQGYFLPVRIIVRAQDGSYMALETGLSDTDWILVSEDGPRVIAHSDQGRLSHYGWNKIHLKIEVKGTIYTAYSDGTMLLRVQDATFESGRVGLAFRYPIENTPRFDNFVVTELR